MERKTRMGKIRELRKDKIKNLRTQYENLAVEEAQLRVGLAQLEEKRASLRVRIIGLSD